MSRPKTAQKSAAVVMLVFSGGDCSGGDANESAVKSKKPATNAINGARYNVNMTIARSMIPVMVPAARGITIGLIISRAKGMTIIEAIANFLNGGWAWLVFGAESEGAGEIAFHNGRKMRARKAIRPSGPY